MSNFSLNFKTAAFLPLAARMRPTTVEEYIGQTHLIAKGKPLYSALQRGLLYSMIFWGPPGSGKTTLAELIAHQAQAEVEKISAVTAGVKEIRESIERAKSAQYRGVRTILFVDEVHRFNKNQQDAFLPYIENGTIIFIGATTENPSFELNSALLSRVKVHILQTLSPEEIQQIIYQALSGSSKGLGLNRDLLPEEVALELALLAQGDARRALNLLEMMVELEQDQLAQGTPFSLAMLAKVAGGRTARFDKKGDHYYDLISAFHKSVRGSAPDAALYWYARILVAGGDPLYVARRLLAIATEDIGMADPRALEQALNAWDCYTRVGAAEGERAIAQATLYLACAAKSNAVYQAFNHALSHAKETSDYAVPMHLRNAPTGLLKEMGAGEGYRYAHHEANGYAAGENYFPKALQEQQYYMPTSRGLEAKVAEKLSWLRKLDDSSTVKRYVE